MKPIKDMAVSEFAELILGVSLTEFQKAHLDGDEMVSFPEIKSTSKNNTNYLIYAIIKHLHSLESKQDKSKRKVNKDGM